MRPISNRNNGVLKSLAVALALNDLPQPGIPAIRTPFGISTPKALAASISLYIFALFWIHSFKTSKPPISFIVSSKAIISKTPDFFTICFFCSNTNSRSLEVISPSSE